MEERHIRTAPFEERTVHGDYGRRTLALPGPLTYFSIISNAPMSTSNITLDDLNPTPEEKKLSMIASEIWGIGPVRQEDGEARPLIALSDDLSLGQENVYRGRLRKIGIIGSDTDLPELSLEEGWWTPIRVSSGGAVMQGGNYKYLEGEGLVYEDFDSMADDLHTALLKVLDFERNGTPRERPHKLGAGPAVDL